MVSSETSRYALIITPSKHPYENKPMLCKMCVVPVFDLFGFRSPGAVDCQGRQFLYAEPRQDEEVVRPDAGKV